ncbi:hypothetical protein [Candidatus Regiella endosymbiont of Tuberolachnus salignus]|uniref:hypothetical protein n=1 Tax=Candidatus Regiella endosymbiont of Tuberolachnus salignus TaxID=3077956 RepID=UPI0030CBC57D
MLISLMALSPQRKLHSGLSGQIKLAIYGLLSLALTTLGKPHHVKRHYPYLGYQRQHANRPQRSSTR